MRVFERASREIYSKSVSDVYKFLAYTMHARVHLHARLKFCETRLQPFMEALRRKSFAHVKPMSRRASLTQEVRHKAGLVRGGRTVFRSASNKSENCTELVLLKELRSQIRGILMKFLAGITYSQPSDTTARVFKVECAIICVHGPAVHPVRVYIPRCIIHE